jgi:hypothetical protein
VTETPQKSAANQLENDALIGVVCNWSQSPATPNNSGCDSVLAACLSEREAINGRFAAYKQCLSRTVVGKGLSICRPTTDLADA